MISVLYLGVVAAILASGYVLGILKINNPKSKLPCRKVYYGIYTLATVSFGALIGLLASQIPLIIGLLKPYFSETTFFSCLAGMVIMKAYALIKITPAFNARKGFEFYIKALLLLSALVCIFVTFSIIFSMIFESIRFFKLISPAEFLFGKSWAPHVLSDEHPGDYGAIPLFMGTLLVTLIAMAIAIPLGIFTAVYLAFYASERMQTLLKPALELLAGIPSLVFGFFAIIFVSPLVVNFGHLIGLDISSECALIAGIVMGFMILPYIASLSEDILSSIPNAFYEASLGLGATKAETIKRVLLPAAFPGLMATIIVGFSRAIGETMLVVMALGLSANLTLNPLQSVTTVTVQIVSLLTGDQSFNSPAPLSAFALGLVLFIVTFALNMVSHKVVTHYRQKYAY